MMPSPPRQLIVLVALAGWAGAAEPMTVEHLEVGERERSYFVEFEAYLAAPPAAVMEVLQDYGRYPELDARVVESRIVGEQDGRPLLFTRLHGCLGAIFCRDMDRFEQLDEGAALLVATAVSGKGDLARGRTETRVEPDGDGARVRYRTEFEPSFWMPRWMVRSAMARTLEEGTLNMFRNVEARAQEAGR